VDKMVETTNSSSGPMRTNYDLRLFSSLLVPSALSGLLSVLVSLFAVGTIAVLTNYQGSSFQQDVLRVRSGAEKEAVIEDYNYINDDLERNIIIDRAPVMVFWMFVGTLVYFMVTGVSGAVAGARSLERELGYVHVRSKELLRHVYIKSAIRFCVLGVWLGFIMLFFRLLLPYCLAAAHVGAGNVTSVTGVFYIVLAIIVLTISFHIHVVMLRLVVLRPRLFSQETSF
jgi:hypothetical protein